MASCHCFLKYNLYSPLFYTTYVDSISILVSVGMDDIPIFIDYRSPRFIDRLRLCIRSRNLSYATEKTYVYWVLQFIRFHRKRHPDTMPCGHTL